jgi:hypothetical protein
MGHDEVAGIVEVGTRVRAVRIGIPTLAFTAAAAFGSYVSGAG